MKHDTVAKMFHMLSTDDFKHWFDRRFNSDTTFHFNVEIGNHKAFFCYEIPMFEKLLNLQDKNSELNSLFSSLPRIASNQYIRNSLVVDVKKTNEIEGVFSSKKEIFELTEDFKKRKSNKIGSIVNKYLMLLDGKTERNIKTCSDIRKIYDDLFFSEGASLLDDDKKLDGKLFRKGFVGVFNTGSNEPVHKGVTPEEEIIRYLDEAIAILNNESLNVFVRSAIFHYLFEYAHPFYDGNGRVGRYLISSFYKNKISNIFSFRISAGINNFRNQYYKAFEDTEFELNKGDLTLFVYEFLDIIDKTYDDCLKYASKKKAELDQKYKEYCEKFSKLTKNEKNVMFVLTQASVFSDFGITIKEIEKTINVSTRTIRRALDIFKSHDVLKESRISHSIYYNLV